MAEWTRRNFFFTTLGAGMLAGTKRLLGAAPLGAQAAAGHARPLILSSVNGLKHLDRGMTVLKKGGDTLDAVLAVVTAVEDDPNDDSVGYGGLPNEDGEVELDASVMHGPTHRAGSVASIRKIKNPSLVARTVMERTNH
ncbi:MAG TPA: isoaspartyl peptidase/L-asparaginase, partial [Candidatus Acidoferrales bacterium]|nr:isoaspartyl peptidase/L-asparaginase [Candidatus Acidoferrales bacterium]